MKWACKLVLALFVLSLFQGWFLFHPTELDSATLTDARDLLENSRLSYLTALEGAHDTNATTITIDKTNYTDKDNYHIFPGDSVTIGSNSYTVGTVIDDATDDKFTITTGLDAGDTADDTAVYVNQTATHTIYFTAASAVADGAIRVSIPATSDDTDNSDSKPDIDGFDFDSAAGVSCTPDVEFGDYDFVTGTATDEGSNGTSDWHTFECRYSGNGSGSTALTMTIGTSNELINPAPETGHNRGTADDYTTRIQNLDGSDDVIDSVDVKVVLIEAVRVTATVEATLSFTIAGRNSGNTHCGQAADVTTTVYSVPFGSLTANSFTDGAHDLEVSTNADDGYSVTVRANDQMGLNGGACTGDLGEADNCIKDTTCDGETCTHESTATDDWETDATNGFGYSLDAWDGTDSKWEWDSTNGTCDGTGEDFCAAQFADAEAGQTAQEIMDNDGPVDSKNMYVCYRISISGTQPAGDYYNTVTYIATPQF